MAYKNTIAIIGAAATLGSIIAKGIAHSNNRLLLMDDGYIDQLTNLKNEIVQLNNDAEIELLHCCKDASWEADTIIVAIDIDKHTVTANLIKEVATCKTIISFTWKENPGNELQKILVHSKVINVVLSKNLDTAGNINAAVFGKDKEALQTTVEIIKMLGFSCHHTNDLLQIKN